MTPLFLESDALPPPQTNGSERYGQNESEILRQAYYSHKPEFANLTTAKCIDIYAADFVTGYSDVIVVISDPYPKNASTIAWTYEKPIVEQYTHQQNS